METSHPRLKKKFRLKTGDSDWKRPSQRVQPESIPIEHDSDSLYNTGTGKKY